MAKNRKKIVEVDDHKIYVWFRGKFIRTGREIRLPGSLNFRIVCEYGDWSPYLSLGECQRRMAQLQRDYGEKKENFFFSVLED